MQSSWQSIAAMQPGCLTTCGVRLIRHATLHPSAAGYFPTPLGFANFSTFEVLSNATQLLFFAPADLSRRMCQHAEADTRYLHLEQPTYIATGRASLAACNSCGCWV